MDYEKPEGCRAAVTVNWEYPHRDAYKLVARLVCGERQNVCDYSYERQWMNIGDEKNQIGHMYE